MHTLLAVEVRNVHAQVETGGDGDRTQRIVRTHPDVLRLCQRGNAAQLRDTATPCDIWHDVVNQSVVDDLPVVPTREVALSNAQRHIDVLAHVLQRVVILNMDRLLQPDEPNVLQCTAGLDRRCDIEARVCIHHQLVVVANCLAQSFHPSDGFPHSRRVDPLHHRRAAEPATLATARERVGLDGLKSRRLGLSRVFLHRLEVILERVAVGSVADVRVDWHAFTHRSA